MEEVLRGKAIHKARYSEMTCKWEVLNMVLHYVNWGKKENCIE